MAIFKPKKGPALQWSRVYHMLIAATVTAAGGHFFGYQGAAIACASAIGFGFLWEVGNKWFPGKHMYGDLLDFLAFVVGAALTAGGWVAVSNMNTIKALL